MPTKEFVKDQADSYDAEVETVREAKELPRYIPRWIVRQRLIGDRYLLLTDRTQTVGSLGLGILDEDGHPTRFPTSNTILTDTYPDASHRRTLILFDFATRERTDVGRFYSLPDEEHWIGGLGEGWEVSGMRSDLHPRWNRDESQICIDSVHGGTRQMYVVDVSERKRA